MDYNKTTTVVLIVLFISPFGNGKPDVTSTETSSNFLYDWSNTKVILLLGFDLLFGFILGLSSVCVAEWCCKKTSSYAPVKTDDKETENTPESVKDLETEDEALTVETKPVKPGIVDNLETVVKALKKHYRTARELTLYTACSCVITGGNGPQKSTSDKILDEEFIKSTKHVVIIGEEGFGKTYLLQYVLQKWAKGIILNDSILIYIKLDGLSGNSCILEEVEKSMKLEIQSAKAISSALQKKDVIVLLDGAHNLNSDINSQTNSNALTVENLLNKTYQSKFPKLKVWATFRSKVGQVTFETPNTLVNLNGFINSQRKTYWRNSINVFKQIGLKETTNGDSIGESSFQAVHSESESTKLIEACWDNTFQQLDITVTKSPLLANIFLLGYLGEMDFDLTENVCILALFKKWKIADWCPKFKEKDVLFDRDNLYYNKELMNDFCTSCLKFQVTLRSLTFRGDYPTTSCLPDIEEELKLDNVNLRKGDCFNLIQHYADKSLHITFIEPGGPMTFTQKQIQQMKKGEHAGLTVCYEEGKKKYQFNFNAANWEEQ